MQTRLFTAPWWLRMSSSNRDRGNVTERVVPVFFPLLSYICVWRIKRFQYVVRTLSRRYQRLRHLHKREHIIAVLVFHVTPMMVAKP
jgi:hypothetical protein